MPRRLTLALAVVAAVLTLPASAAAALPAAEPPTREALATAGAKLTWPLTKPETVAQPGDRFTVRVRRGSARVAVSLVTVDAAGRPLRVLTKRTLRRGTFTATLPQAAPALYALRLTVGGRTYRSWIAVPEPPSLHCDVVARQLTSASLAFTPPPPTPLAAPAQLQLVLANTGQTCFPLDHLDAKLERESPPGAWAEVQQLDAAGNRLAAPAVLLTVRPGTSVNVPVFVPPGAPAGRYRVRIPRATVTGDVVSPPFVVG